MEKWIKGEEYSREAKVLDLEKMIVEIKHVSKFKNGEKHYLTTRVRLDGETREFVLINAAYNALIQVLRPRALKPFNPSQIDEEKDFRPCDYPPQRGGGPRDPKKTVSDNIAKMDWDTFREYMKEDMGITDMKTLTRIANKKGIEIPKK